jgi:hypothetical protein
MSAAAGRVMAAICAAVRCCPYALWSGSDTSLAMRLICACEWMDEQRERERWEGQSRSVEDECRCAWGGGGGHTLSFTSCGMQAVSACILHHSPRTPPRNNRGSTPCKSAQKRAELLQNVKGVALTQALPSLTPIQTRHHLPPPLFRLHDSRTLKSSDVCTPRGGASKRANLGREKRPLNSWICEMSTGHMAVSDMTTARHSSPSLSLSLSSGTKRDTLLHRKARACHPRTPMRSP